MTTRSHFSLPYQTLQDSVTVYAWSDGRPVNFHRPHSFLNTQAAGADALEQLSKLLAGQHPSARRYQDTAHAMRMGASQRLLGYEPANVYEWCWAGAPRCSSSTCRISRPDGRSTLRGGARYRTTTAYNVLPLIVNRLFSDEFLTEAGLRMRSKYIREPLGDLVDYHGAQKPVWPITTFLVAGRPAPAYHVSFG